MRLFSVNCTTPVGIEIYSKARVAGNMEILVLVLYQEEWGSVDP